MPRFVPLVAVFIAAALIQGVVAHREAAARLDVLVRELGETVAEAAAVGLRSSLAFTRARAASTGSVGLLLFL